MPATAQVILESNSVYTKNLKGIGIGNGWVDPYVQYNAYAKVSTLHKLNLEPGPPLAQYLNTMNIHNVMRSRGRSRFNDTSEHAYVSHCLCILCVHVSADLCGRGEGRERVRNDKWCSNLPAVCLHGETDQPVESGQSQRHVLCLQRYTHTPSIFYLDSQILNLLLF